jgi:hypothetical protein
MAHTSANLLVHLVFSTKERRAFIHPGMKGDLCSYLGGIVREMKETSLIINGTADHVHLLLRIPPFVRSRRWRVSSSRTPRNGFTRNGRRTSSVGKQGTEPSPSVYRMSCPSPGTPRTKKSIMSEEPSRKSSWRSSRRTALRSMSATSGIDRAFFRPRRGSPACLAFPWLAPWALFFRRFAAGRAISDSPSTVGCFLAYVTRQSNMQHRRASHIDSLQAKLLKTRQRLVSA